ncbi:histamine H2 receptor-like [Dendronephthya gigantea]|uniref:histamine H2 receptor-like n=1 Tax=Dendronephthya gigantea TaxID=151771 RepID=UPI00106C4578|nr:histamine H2 receptor-like [Dendronephthya gigantea]
MMESPTSILGFTTEEPSGSGSGFWSGSGSGYHNDDDDINLKAYFIPLCFLAGIIVVVNIFIVLLVCRNVKLRSNCNALVVSLAVADGTSGLVGIPVYVILHFVQDKMTLVQLCFTMKSLHTWFWFMSIVSIFHLLVIACEQYLAILKPFSHDKIVTKRSTGLTLAIIWIVAIGHSFVPWTWVVPQSGEFCFEHDEKVVQNDKIYAVVSFITFFLLPIAMLFFVYFRIVSEAKRQLGRIKRDSVCSKKKYPNLSSCTRYRGFYIIGLMWVVFFLCWAPYFASVLYETFTDDIQFKVSYALTVLRFLPSVLNPIMFAFWRSDFRAACIEKFCCCGATKDHTRSTISSGKQQLPLIRLSDSKDCKPQNV